MSTISVFIFSLLFLHYAKYEKRNVFHILQIKCQSQLIAFHDKKANFKYAVSCHFNFFKIKIQSRMADFEMLKYFKMLKSILLPLLLPIPDTPERRQPESRVF